MLNCLLYADDLVLISESESGLQYGLNRLLSTVKIGNLSINVENSKVIIFNKLGKRVLREFIIANEKLENVHKYIYLHVGTDMTPNGNLFGVIKHLCEKATKSLGRLKRTFFFFADVKYGVLSPHMCIITF